MSRGEFKIMTEALTTLREASETLAETTVTAVNTDSLGVIISSAINSENSQKDKIQIILSVIWNKLLDLLPVLCWSVISLIIGLFFTGIVIHLLKKVMKNSKADPAAAGFLSSLIKIFLYTITLIIALSILGVPITSLIAVLSAAGLTVGLALQGSLSNLAGGFIILISKPFKAGDYIETNSAAGFVESISILYTKIITLDNKAVYIPNGNVTNATISNFSEKGERRIDHEFAISYDQDFEFAKKVILETARRNPLIQDTPAPPFARIKAHGDDSIIIKSEVWAKSGDYWQVLYDMYEQVYAAFNENGISIPFRQLDVHMIPMAHEKPQKENNSIDSKEKGETEHNGKQ